MTRRNGSSSGRACWVVLGGLEFDSICMNVWCVLCIYLCACNSKKHVMACWFLLVLGK